MNCFSETKCKNITNEMLQSYEKYLSCSYFTFQGPSLGPAHILGLAAFVIHLSECRALIPGVEANFGVSQPVPGKALSVSEYWSSLLVCRTEESFTFCLR